jgi:hypothetical protein
MEIKIHAAIARIERKMFEVVLLYKESSFDLPNLTVWRSPRPN